jgi:intracellular septation protein
MKEALWHLLDDLSSAVLFLLAYALSGRLDVALGAVVLLAAVPVLRLVLQRRPVARLRWLSLALVLILAGAGWLLQSPRFMMARPSAVHFVLAAAMSRRGWLRPYLNSAAQQHVPSGLVAATGYGWAVLMAALGFTNLIVALYFDLGVWGWFIAAVSPGAKLVALVLQYGLFRALRRQGLMTAGAGLRLEDGADIRRGGRRSAPGRATAPQQRNAEQDAQAQNQERREEAFRPHRRRRDQAELGP